MEILRPGHWNDWDFPADYLRELQASYDPDVREAPITQGHPHPLGEEKPAYGWVKKLELRPFGDDPDVDDISVWALVELGEEAEGWIEERKFPKRSVGISEDSPYPGIPYLSHVALLGASNPAVSSLTEVELAQGFISDGMLCLAQVSGADKTLVWESKDKEYWYRVKDPSRFKDDSFRSKSITSGVRAVMGKLKPEYVPEGSSADSMHIQSLRFDKEKFDLAKAKAWVKDHKGELSQMADEKTLQAVEGENKTLKAEVDELRKQLNENHDKLATEKERAEKAERELREQELIRLESKYEHELKQLTENGNGAPAYIELGVHKALRAMDASDISVELNGKSTPASEIIMSALKSVPKFIERREVAGDTTIKSGEDGQPDPPGNDRFALAMKKYSDEGGKVDGLDVKALTDKLMAEDKTLDIKSATLKASKMLAGGAR